MKEPTAIAAGFALFVLCLVTIGQANPSSGPTAMRDKAPCQTDSQCQTASDKKPVTPECRALFDFYHETRAELGPILWPAIAARCGDF